MKTKNSVSSKSGRRGYLRLLLVSAVLLLSVAWVTFSHLFYPLNTKERTVEIPPLLGLRLQELQVPEWIDLGVEYRYDESVPEGVVIAQEPLSGSRRKLSDTADRCSVTVTVSMGRETAILPDLYGEDGALAANRLRQMGFLVETVEKNGVYPVGTVFEMEPVPGTRLGKGALVRLTVSAGQPQRSVEVPDLVGLSRSDALVRLWMSGLAVSSVEEVASDCPVSLVVRQSHRPGTLVPAGTGIILYVSTGEANETEE